jgi:small membrane protein
MITQIFLSSIIIFIIYKTILSYRKEKLSLVFIVLWVLLWLTILFFVLDVRALVFIAHSFGIGRGVDFAIYISILFLLYVFYKVLVKVEKMNRDMTKIVREIAISNAKLRKK